MHMQCMVILNFQVGGINKLIIILLLIMCILQEPPPPSLCMTVCSIQIVEYINSSNYNYNNSCYSKLPNEFSTGCAVNFLLLYKILVVGSCT